MIKLIPYTSLGRVQHGWLDARHHFSFGEYRDANRMGFGVLRVVNDDIIQGGSGFGTHPHKDMEIITFVRDGAITHEDSLGNIGRTPAGDVQVMSAGTGVSHSEFNRENQATRLYQIWITPNQKNVTPKWESAQFPSTPASDLLLLVAGDGSAPLHIHQDAFIYGGVILKGTVLSQRIRQQAYILISKGSIAVGSFTAKAGDALEITDQALVEFTATEDAELLLIDVPLA